MQCSNTRSQSQKIDMESCIQATSSCSYFQTNGYEVWQKFLTQHQLKHLRTKVNVILNNLHPSVDPEWIQHVHQLKEGTFLRNLATSVKHLASDYLNDPNPILYSSQISCRYPGTEVKTPWHQDGPGAGVVTFWITLDRIDETNGGLQVIPKGHLNGRQRLKTFDTNTTTANDFDCAVNMASHNVFEIESVQSSNVFKYRLRAGGAGVHHDSIPHCSNPNVSITPRRVIILRYMHHDTKQVEGKFLHYKTGLMETRT